MKPVVSVDITSIIESLRSDGWVSTSEAALVLNSVSYRYVYYLTKRGSLHYQKLGDRRYYNIEELLKYRNEHPLLGTRRASKHQSNS